MAAPFRVLILKDAGLAVDIEDDLKLWKEYELEHLGFDLKFEQRIVSLGALKHESFKITQVSDGVSKDLYGLSGIKDRVRPLVAEGMYDLVVFVYDIEDCELYRQDRAFALDHIANWTYFTPLYAGMPFTEVVSRKSWSKTDPFRVFSHENRHALCFRLRALGYAIPDVMDITYSPAAGKEVPYYKEYDVYAVDGNRGVQNLLLKPYIEILAGRPEVLSFIERLKKQVADLMNKLAAMTTTKTPDSPGMIKWAEAIKKHEGWYVGSRSYRNLNPGNMRLTPYTRSLGALARGDDKNFAIFPTYDAGWNALLQFLRDARANQLIAYREYAKRHGRAIPSLNDFFQVYAPEFENDTNHYAQVVATAIGCTPDTLIDRI